MATDNTFVMYVCESIAEIGLVTSRKMFGEYMVYVNGKPIFLVCDNTVYVKILDAVKDLLGDAERGRPYESAKEHYILDMDNTPFVREVAVILEQVTPLPKKKKKPEKKV